MRRAALDLPGPIVLVPSRAIAADPSRLAADGVGLEEVIADLRLLATRATLAVRLLPDKRQLILYTQRHEIGLYPTERNDAYRISHITPISFAAQRRLISCALVLRLPDVGLIWSLSNAAPLPPNHWRTILHAWIDLEQQPDTDTDRPDTSLPEHHLAYLDLLSEVIEAGRRIEIERYTQIPPTNYRNRRTTLEQRHTGRDVYAFDLVDPRSVPPGSHVRLDDERQRGQVIQVAGSWASVRFTSRIDYSAIPAQGTLRVLPGTTVYRAQAAAVETLRRGESVCTGLLSILVDRRLTPYRTDDDLDPLAPLDTAQLQALRQAVAVPDQLLVLGPPGTGKTRVITEICLLQSRLGRRVLLSAQTNQALDNVLERMPPEVLAVRVGSEDRTTQDARSLLVGARTAEVRQQILGSLEATRASLVPFTANQPMLRWNAHLDDQVRRLEAACALVDHHRSRREQAEATAAAPMASALRQARGSVADCQSRTELAKAAWAVADRRTEHRPGLRSVPLVGTWLQERRNDRAQRLFTAFEGRRGELADAQERLDALTRQAEQHVAADPTVTRLVGEEHTARETVARVLADCSGAAAVISRSLILLSPAIPLPAPPPDPDPFSWKRYRTMVDDAVQLAGRRADILAAWSDRLHSAEDTLNHELVRYADVVAATCTGSATAPELSGLDFDLALVDEAGQISTPNLLMPLVKARRSVLVGDHHQLPPYLDEEVRGWAEHLRNQGSLTPATLERIEDLLRRSAFEQLYRSSPEQDSHRVMLNVQRRMPSVIGDFVSAAFYERSLWTVHPDRRIDQVFHSPLAVVDTSDQPERRRRERRRRASEAWQTAGYVNDLEAALIADLVAERRGSYDNWAVILPYRAQVEQVRKALTQRLGAAVAPEEVGTVDSFQGGERDLVIYGFTRSNREGNIGFLSELRRVNVAITRARRQLVIVGDLNMLRQARDPDFAALVDMLVEHVDAHGDHRHSLEFTVQGPDARARG